MNDYDDNDDGTSGIRKLAALQRGNKPIIELTVGDLSPIAVTAENLLHEAGAPLYQRAGLLVRPIIEAVDASNGRGTRSVQLKALDTPFMRYLLATYIDWRRQDGRTGKLARA
jgi:hypothetical protein